MVSPTPVQSFLGGVGLVPPVYALLRLNGCVFGISGFVHRAIKGNREALSAIAGLVAGGAVVGLFEHTGPQPAIVEIPRILLAGFLVGLGTKLSNGCTSGHMICGVSRLSLRSIAATATFCVTGAITAILTHTNLPPAGSFDWSLGRHGKALLALQVVPLLITSSLYAFAPPSADQGKTTGTQAIEVQTLTPAQRLLRYLAFMTTSIEFAFALRLSNLTDPGRVVSFLVLPFNRAFDASLVFLALGALPSTMILYHCARGSEKTRLGGAWGIPSGGDIDAKLLAGAAIFGVGWGLAGICPGPALVNLGQALVTGSNLSPIAGWVIGALAGGLLA
ncbi:hypothetical protein AX17_002919 [Amanita inopinata Kibby_2008]|nr:hypothetical protein AX17_002919 [Amanita inopinata Kibby_2008]